MGLKGAELFLFGLLENHACKKYDGIVLDIFTISLMLNEMWKASRISLISSLSRPMNCHSSCVIYCLPVRWFRPRSLRLPLTGDGAALRRRRLEAQLVGRPAGRRH